MSGDLVPLDQLDSMAVQLAKSGLFQGKTKEQIFGLLMFSHAEGVHPMTAMRDFDIINGRPAKKAEAMHRSFIAAGGSIEWHTLDDTKADATFKHPQGGAARIVWDLKRVEQAQIKNEAMYKKYPRQMLRSRCISEGCRTVYPAATSGLYEPGEVQGITEKNMGPAAVVEDEPKLDERPKVVPEQIEAIKKALTDHGVEMAALLAKAEIVDISELAAEDAPGAIRWIEKKKKAA